MLYSLASEKAISFLCAPAHTPSEQYGHTGDDEPEAQTASKRQGARPGRLLFSNGEIDGKRGMDQDDALVYSKAVLVLVVAVHRLTASASLRC